jgi:hypothetical protein
MAPASPAFWTEYKAVLTKLNVPEKKVNFYLGWAQRFERFMNGVPFQEAKRFRRSGRAAGRFSGSATS